MDYVCACCACLCERMQRLPSITVCLILLCQGSLHFVLMFFISHPPGPVSPSTGVAGAQETTPSLLHRCWDPNSGPQVQQALLSSEPYALLFFDGIVSLCELVKFAARIFLN